MSAKLSKEPIALLKEFKEMQARHLAVISGREVGSVRILQEERQAMLERLQHLFAGAAPTTSPSEDLKKELQSILEKEKVLRTAAATRHRDVKSKLETLRKSKKVLSGYSEKGYGLGDSPHFVSRTT